MALRDLSAERRRRIARRALPVLVILGVAAFVIGLVVGAFSTSSAERLAGRFASAWSRSDYGAMYGMLTKDAKARISERSFAGAYRLAAQTATAVAFERGRVRRAAGGARVAMTVRTRVFGILRGTVVLRVKGGGVDWRPQLVFPGLHPGEILRRRTLVPRRAAILANDGTTIASGPANSRTIRPGAGASIAGSLGPAPAGERAALEARGFPPDTKVGTSGLERALELRLEGVPGGTLLAGSRTIASARSRPAADVRSSIDLDVQAAAVQALGGRFGGIAAIEPRTGRVRALAGIAFSAPQPPGSTFKIVTATAALAAHLVEPSTPFPVQTQATIEGVPLENANGESCGGTFAESFAESCNSVFAPLGVRIGAKRLVATAERFGFNERPPIAGAAPSTLPQPGQVGGPLAVGSTAIGQGKVLATPLEMAVIAATIGERGVRREPTLLQDAKPQTVARVTTRRVARTVEKLMIGVVQHGTGTSASLAPITVAGKTGTAELQTTVPRAPPSEQGGTNAPQGQPPETDAWFACYAPVGHPKLAVGVMFVKAGAGGDVAAPAAKVVLQAALSRGG